MLVHRGVGVRIRVVFCGLWSFELCVLGVGVAVVDVVSQKNIEGRSKVEKCDGNLNRGKQCDQIDDGAPAGNHDTSARLWC